MDIFYEAGEAIGNVGRRLLRRKRRSQAEEALERWSARVPLPKISPTQEDRLTAEDEVIDVSYRVIQDDE